MANNGLTFAWTIDGKGGGVRIDEDNIAEEIRNIGLAWVHINDSDHEAREWMEKEFTYLDSIILDALLEEETYPRYLEYQDGLLLILRGVNLNPEQQPEDMVSLRCWVDQHRIITIERRSVRTVSEIDKNLEMGKGPKNGGDFLIMLTEHLFDHIDDSMARLHDCLDTVEDRLEIDQDSVTQKDITSLRRTAMTFHRYISPQREVLDHLRHSKVTWLTTTQRREFSEDWNTVNRMLENLDFLRDRARIIYDELNSLSNQKTNRNLYLISGISTIFMPLTYITGLLGMNVEGIPGAHDPWAFVFVTFLTFIIGIVLAALFKWLKWF